MTEVLRQTVVSLCPEPVPHWVSGHERDGRPSRRAHLAFLHCPSWAASEPTGIWSAWAWPFPGKWTVARSPVASTRFWVSI